MSERERFVESLPKPTETGQDVDILNLGEHTGKAARVKSFDGQKVTVELINGDEMVVKEAKALRVKT